MNLYLSLIILWMWAFGCLATFVVLINRFDIPGSLILRTIIWPIYVPSLLIADIWNDLRDAG